MHAPSDRSRHLEAKVSPKLAAIGGNHTSGGITGGGLFPPSNGMRSAMKKSSSPVKSMGYDNDGALAVQAINKRKKIEALRKANEMGRI